MSAATAAPTTYTPTGDTYSFAKYAFAYSATLPVLSHVAGLGQRVAEVAAVKVLKMDLAAVDEIIVSTTAKVDTQVSPYIVKARPHVEAALKRAEPVVTKATPIAERAVELLQPRVLAAWTTAEPLLAPYMAVVQKKIEVLDHAAQVCDTYATYAPVATADETPAAEAQTDDAAAGTEAAPVELEMGEVDDDDDDEGGDDSDSDDGDEDIDYE